MHRQWDPVSALLGLAKAWKQITGFTALALFAAWLVLSVWPREYRAETLVLLDPRNQPNLQLDEVLAGIAPDDQTISSEVLILRSAELAARVIGDLSLASDPDFNPVAVTEHGFWNTILPVGLRDRFC